MATKRLIDANALMEDARRCSPFVACLGDIVDIELLVNDQPTVDAVEVVHGEWVFGELDMCGAPVKCSNCGYGVENADPILWVTYPGHKFCGACGAKMDGDGNA